MSFKSLQFLPTKYHGGLDYAVAAVLVIAPFALDFFADSELAGWLSFGAGLALFLYSLTTDYEAGIRHALSIRQHLVLDGAAGGAFVVLAFAAGFETVTALFYGIVGGAVLLVVLVTKVPDKLPNS